MGYFGETLPCSHFLMNEGNVRDLFGPETLYPAIIAIIKNRSDIS